MKKQIFFIIVAVAVVLFTACETVEIPAPDSDNAIEFHALVDKNGSTRASLVDKTEDLTNFFVAAGLALVSPQENCVQDLTFMEAAVWRTFDDFDNKYFWTYAPKKYYPTDNSPLSFFAYAPIKDVNMGNKSELMVDEDGKVNFNYIVPFDQSKSNTAVDLLVASDVSKTEDDNPVEFEFNHALSGVTFSAINNNPEESELVYVISDIEITALSNQGTFTYPFSDNSWKINSAGRLVAYKPGLPESGVSLMPVMTNPAPTPLPYVKLLSANDIMMVLPQTTNVDIKEPIGAIDNSSTVSFVNVTYSLKDGSGSFVFKDKKLPLQLPLNFTFKSGTLYNFQFQFEKSEAITFKVKLEEWKPKTEDLK